MSTPNLIVGANSSAGVLLQALKVAGQIDNGKVHAIIHCEGQKSPQLFGLLSANTFSIGQQPEGTTTAFMAFKTMGIEDGTVNRVPINSVIQQSDSELVVSFGQPLTNYTWAHCATVDESTVTGGYHFDVGLSTVCVASADQEQNSLGDVLQAADLSKPFVFAIGVQPEMPAVQQFAKGVAILAECDMVVCLTEEASANFMAELEIVAPEKEAVAA